MREAVLRISGSLFDVDGYLEQFGFVADTVWRAGERGPRGRVQTDSGFNLSIASGPSLCSEMRAWLSHHAPALNRLREFGASAEIDVGVTVGETDAYTASVTLEPADLGLLAEYGISFRVSAFPCSDESEPT